MTVDDPAAASSINALNDEISQRRSDASKLNATVESYRKKIAAMEAQTQTLAVESELLDNRVAKSELDIQATDAEIEAVNDEITILETRMNAISAQLVRDRESIGEILRTMDVYDNDLSLQLLFGSDSFGALFDRLQQLASVTADLQDALGRAEAERAAVESDRAAQVGKRTNLADLQLAQEKQKDLLEDEKASKETLLAQTERSEAQFQIFLSSLRAEQQSVNNEIASLQDAVEQKLRGIDGAGQGSKVLSWPVPPLKGLSTLFHDPTYPYRHLFEHPGIDLPTPAGTPVKSAAPGYVAWTKTGPQYGNYVMVIHSDGVATLYAHLQRFNVVADQFVDRGDVLGYSGGVPGMPGAGLSTGAHLHFEVRLNGVPTDPLNGYLTLP
ncbi:hypothetical protein EBS80_03105 [bacterium]|nr:hypothetical protein [bacterium]